MFIGVLQSIYFIKFTQYVTSSLQQMFRHALKKPDSKLVEELLKDYAVEIYPYIYFNISNHWRETKWRKVFILL